MWDNIGAAIALIWIAYSLSCARHDFKRYVDHVTRDKIQ